MSYFYEYKLTIYEPALEEYNTPTQIVYGLVAADSYKEAMEEVMKVYGDMEILDATIAEVADHSTCHEVLTITPNRGPEVGFDLGSGGLLDLAKLGEACTAASGGSVLYTASADDEVKGEATEKEVDDTLDTPPCRGLSYEELADRLKEELSKENSFMGTLSKWMEEDLEKKNTPYEQLIADLKDLDDAAKSLVEDEEDRYYVAEVADEEDDDEDDYIDEDEEDEDIVDGCDGKCFKCSNSWCDPKEW